MKRWTSFILLFALLLASCARKEGKKAPVSRSADSEGCDPDLDKACLAIAYPAGSSCEVKHYPGEGGLRFLSNEEIGNALYDITGISFDKQMNEVPRRDQGRKFESSTLFVPFSFVFVEKWNEIAQRIAATIVSDKALMTKYAGSCQQTNATCGQALIDATVPLFWRRPVEAQEKTNLLKLFENSATSFQEAALQLVSVLLIDPRFLYRFEKFSDPNAVTEKAGAYELASRLSFFLWRSVPDAALYQKAASGELLKKDALLAEAERMLNEPKAERAFRQFVNEWLVLGNLDNLQLPGESIDAKALKEDVARFAVEKIFTSEDDFRQAFAPESGNNGLLGMAGVLGGLNVGVTTSPVKRGIFLSARILCRDVPPPPPGVGVFKSEVLKVDATPRERLKIHEANPSCAECHSSVDAIGLGMETLDALGRSRNQYPNRTGIDASGSMRLNQGRSGFGDSKGLLSAIAQSQDLAACMTVSMAEYASGAIPGERNSCELSQIQSEFAGQGYRWKSLMKAIVGSASFSTRVRP